jgi:hypothetical protein
MECSSVPISEPPWTIDNMLWGDGGRASCLLRSCQKYWTLPCHELLNVRNLCTPPPPPLMRPKARRLEGWPGWLEESDPAGCDFVRDGRSMPPWRTTPLVPVWGWSLTECTQNTVMSYVKQGRHIAWYSSRSIPCILSACPTCSIESILYTYREKIRDQPHGIVSEIPLFLSISLSHFVWYTPRYCTSSPIFETTVRIGSPL